MKKFILLLACSAFVTAGVFAQQESKSQEKPKMETKDTKKEKKADKKDAKMGSKSATTKEKTPTGDKK